MKSESTKKIEEILKRRRAEVEQAKTEKEKSEIWRLAAAEIRFQTFESQWRSGKEAR